MAVNSNIRFSSYFFIWFCSCLIKNTLKTGRGETVRCEALRQDDPGHEEPWVLHYPPGARILKTIFQVSQVFQEYWRHYSKYNNFQWSWSNKNTEALNDSLDPKDRCFFFTWNQVVMMQTTKIEISSDTFWFFARETFYFRCEGLDWDQFIQDYVMVNIFRAKWWSNSISNTGHNYDLILSIPGHEEVRLETVSRHIACLQVTLSSF